MKRAIISLLLLFVTPTFGQNPNGQRLARLIELAQAEFNRQQLVGLAVVDIEDGKIAWSKGFGFADRDQHIPVDPSQTQFRWASVCKSVTAVAAMQLVEKGQLDLDADIRTYVPEFPDKGVRITPRQLLCHQAGIVHYQNGPVIQTKATYTDLHPFTDPVIALDRFKESPLVNVPGEKYSYSTYGYILLSAIIQRAGHQPFAEQLRTRIAAPLGMTGFRPNYQWENIPHRAVGYGRDADLIKPRVNPEDASWKAGGGGYISPATDMAAFGVGLLGDKLVTSDSKRLMWTVNKPKDPAHADPYGYGFFIVNRPDGSQLIGHDGSQTGGKSALLIEPKSRRGIVVMSNCEWLDAMRLAFDLMNVPL